MEDLDFTSTPAKSAICDPGVARACFESLGKVQSVARGENIFAENHKSDGMYLLLEGEVSLARGKKVIDIVKTGEIFGEMGAISHVPRSATATTRTDCRLISLDARKFQSAIQNTPEFALMLMNIIINRLRLTTVIVGKNLKATEKWHESRVFDQKLLAERVGPGGVFGEMALIDQSTRAATALAETNCYLLSINRNDFLSLVKTKPAFAVSLLKALADRLRYMTSHHR